MVISMEPKRYDVPGIYERVYQKEHLVILMRLFDKAVVVLCMASYLAALILCLINELYMTALKLFVVTVIPYVMLSVFRHLFNAPRPYELYDLSSIMPDSENRKKGRSFPSRHVFSCLLIASALCFLIPWLGAVLIILGIGMGACRVLLAIHFPRDVICGGLIGLICGALGMIIVNFY